MHNNSRSYFFTSLLWVILCLQFHFYGITIEVEFYMFWIRTEVKVLGSFTYLTGNNTGVSMKSILSVCKHTRPQRKYQLSPSIQLHTHTHTDGTRNKTHCHMKTYFTCGFNFFVCFVPREAQPKKNKILFSFVLWEAIHYTALNVDATPKTND